MILGDLRTLFYYHLSSEALCSHLLCGVGDAVYTVVPREGCVPIGSSCLLFPCCLGHLFYASLIYANESQKIMYAYIGLLLA